MYHRLNGAYFKISKIRNLTKGPNWFMGSFFGTPWTLRFDYDNSRNIHLTNVGIYGIVSLSTRGSRLDPEEIAVHFKTKEELDTEFEMISKKQKIYYTGLDADIDALEAQIRAKN